MAFKHGRAAEITVGGTSLSAYCDTADLSIDIDTSDTTTFGASWKTAIEGLAGATIELAGNYDPTASTGPVVILTGLIGTGSAAIVYKPAGSASSGLSRSFSAILTSYKESSPVADKVTFTASLLVTGAVTFG